MPIGVKSDLVSVSTIAVNLGQKDGAPDHTHNINHTHTHNHTHSIPRHYHGKGNLNITSSGTHGHTTTVDIDNAGSHNHTFSTSSNGGQSNIVSSNSGNHSHRFMTTTRCIDDALNGPSTGSPSGGNWLPADSPSLSTSWEDPPKLSWYRNVTNYASEDANNDSYAFVSPTLVQSSWSRLKTEWLGEHNHT
ncbi:hypothetical protein RZS08_11860, partial [Arthrospira platensis SPKY1]|nr:hypothetical protein [Arthrospira platensis SPKY1]